MLKKKNPRRATKSRSKTEPKPFPADHFVGNQENLSDSSPWAPPPSSSPGRLGPDTPSPPQRPGAQPRSPFARALVPVCATQPVPGARCQARGEAGRSRSSSLNSMASVHYYTVRIFIWTAKLKTDFCQNCRSHKNDDTGWGLFSLKKEKDLKTQPNHPQPKPLCALPSAVSE